MSDLHREITETSTQKDSIRLQEPPPERWDPYVRGQGRAPHPDRGGRPRAETNQIHSHGSCLHRLWGLILSAHLSWFDPIAVVIPRRL